MYFDNMHIERDFMRRMIRAYEQDLMQLVAETPDHPGGDWANEHLTILENLRDRTFSKFEQTITF
jgi:hypothetical protein